MASVKYTKVDRFEIEKFDGVMNFGLWQIQVKDVLIQLGLVKALKGRPEKKTKSKGATESSSQGVPDTDQGDSDEEWEEFDARCASKIRLCLAKNVLANVATVPTAKGLWERLEEMYMAKTSINRLYLKEQLHTLKMQEGTKITDHLSKLNSICGELESVGVKVEDEDKALQLIWSLS